LGSHSIDISKLEMFKSFWFWLPEYWWDPVERTTLLNNDYFSNFQDFISPADILRHKVNKLKHYFRFWTGMNWVFFFFFRELETICYLRVITYFMVFMWRSLRLHCLLFCLRKSRFHLEKQRDTTCWSLFGFAVLITIKKSTESSRVHKS
jgi:hypothetical protein